MFPVINTLGAAMGRVELKHEQKLPILHFTGIYLFSSYTTAL